MESLLIPIDGWPIALGALAFALHVLRGEGARLLVPAGTMVPGADRARVPDVRIGAAGEKNVACAAEHGCDAIVTGPLA
jgi:hypothetical protein